MQLFNRFDLRRLETLIHQSWELRRDPKERKEEFRASKSKMLNDWLATTDMREITVKSENADGTVKTLTLEQINNFEF